MTQESTFFSRMDDLSASVGHGMLQGDVEFNQVYARYGAGGLGDLGDGSGDTGVISPTEMSYGPEPNRKPGDTFDHPRGGEFDYLGRSLTDMGPGFPNRVKDAIEGEQPLDDLMIRMVEELSTEAEIRAPREFGILNASAHPTVKSDGSTIYDRPPVIPRLTQPELDALKAAAGPDTTSAKGRVRSVQPNP